MKVRISELIRNILSRGPMTEKEIVTHAIFSGHEFIRDSEDEVHNALLRMVHSGVLMRFAGLYGLNKGGDGQ